MKPRAMKQVRTGVVYAVLVLAVCWTLFPTYWVLATSVKIPSQYFSDPPVWIPSAPTLDHYVSLFTDLDGLRFFRNSTVIAVGSTALTLLVATPAAYAIARHRVGGEGFSFWILSQRMLPPVAAVIPLFLLYLRLNLIDTFRGIILAHSIFNIPFAIWILVGFFRDFPTEIQEQSLVDGSTEFQSLWRIILPLIAPGVVVVALFCFVFSWNELVFAVTFTRGRTETVMKLFESLLQSPTSAQFGTAAAAVVMGIVPAYLITLFFQRYLVRGLTMGGVK